MRVFTSLEAVTQAVGERLGHSEWFTVTQDRITAFADATDDHQWIHVSTDRAKAGPFGGTIAHGYLTLSLLPMLVGQVYRIEGARLVVNYGLNKVRFPAPVPAGCRIRADVTLAATKQIEDGLQILMAVLVEREGADRPVCFAETVTRVYGRP